MDNLVSEFEEHLDLLTLSIQRYAPNPSAASLLISDVDNIGTQLDHLQSILSFKSNQSLKQNVQNHQLNDNLKNILISLSESRKVLNDLPKLSTEQEIKLKQKCEIIKNPENHGDDDNSISKNLNETKTVLSFALKLSKFSKIPRTFDGFLLPNNFIWPGDDNMRRGMLAMASMIPEKIINDENKVDNPDKNVGTNIIRKSNKNNSKDDDDDDDDDQMEEDYDYLPERRNSVGNIDKKEAATVMAELNLLDDSDDD